MNLIIVFILIILFSLSEMPSAKRFLHCFQESLMSIAIPVTANPTVISKSFLYMLYACLPVLFSNILQGLIVF